MDDAVQSLELHLNIIRKDIIIHYLDSTTKFFLPFLHFYYFLFVITMIMTKTGCKN